MLLHVVIMTRPDIQNAVKRPFRHLHDLFENAMLALKHMIRCMSKTKSAALLFSNEAKSTPTASFYSSWGNNVSSKENCGVLFPINGSLIACLNKQTVTAQAPVKLNMLLLLN